jgi:cell division protein FtsB
LKKKRKRKQKKTNFISKAQQKMVRALMLFVLTFLTIVFLFGDHGVYQLYRIKALKRATLKQIEELKTEKEIYAKEKHRLETDMNYIESIAREKYRMAKSGEKVFKVLPRE